MSFPSVFSEIEEMIRQSLLETSTARDIARKAGLRLGGVASGGLPDMWGQFALLTLDEVLEPSTLGYEFAYEASAEFDFHFNVKRYSDVRGATQARLLVWTTAVGNAGSYVFAEIEDGGGDGGFVGTKPTAPLDAVGLHLSEWATLSLPGAGTANAARVLWKIANPPASTGSGAVGLMQLQVR